MGERRIRVGPLDVLNAGNFCVSLVGPVQVGSPEDLLTRVQEMADAGVHTRVGLLPCAGSRDWAYAPVIDSGYVLQSRIDPHEVEDLLGTLLARVRTRPIEICADGDYVALAYDHGLGDAKFYGELVAVLSTARTGLRRVVDPMSQLAPINPLSHVLRARMHDDLRGMTSALAQSFLVTIGRNLPHKRTSRSPDAFRGQEAVPGQKLSVVAIRATNGFAGCLDQRCKAAQPTLSRAALIAHALHRAFDASPIEMSNHVEVLVDLRRGLRAELAGSLANAFAVVDIPLSPSGTVNDFSASLKERVAANRSTARLLTSLALRYPVHAAAGIVRRPQRKFAGHGRRPTGPACLTISDISQLRVVKKFGWIDDQQPRIHAVAMGPGSHSHISVSVAEANGVLNITATFNEHAFDRATVRAAMKSAMASLETWLEFSA